MSVEEADKRTYLKNQSKKEKLVVSLLLLATLVVVEEVTK